MKYMAAFFYKYIIRILKHIWKVDLLVWMLSFPNQHNIFFTFQKMKISNGKAITLYVSPCTPWNPPVAVVSSVQFGMYSLKSLVVSLRGQLASQWWCGPGGTAWPSSLELKMAERPLDWSTKASKNRACSIREGDSQHEASKWRTRCCS